MIACYPTFMPLLFFVLFIISCLSISCSRIPEEPSTVYPIHGTWESNCEKKLEGSFSGGSHYYSYSEEFYFRDKRAQRTERKFADDACGDGFHMWTKVMTGTITIDEALAPELVEQPIDFKFSSIEAIAKSEDGQSDLQRTIEIGSYPINESVDITNSPHKETMLYFDLYQIMDNKLHFGRRTESLDGSTSSTRPLEIDTTIGAKVFSKAQ